jgi:hypothetical protein
MPKTFFADDVSLMSPPWSRRTAKYIEALTREGDNFDYHQWLKSVREEEAQAKQVPIATPRAIVADRADSPINASDSRDATPRLGPALICKPRLNLRTLRQRHHRPKSKTPKARLRRWLEKVRRAWDEFQGSRQRDGVYRFLTAVFDIVMHYKVRRRTNWLLRHAVEFAHLPLNNNNTDPFSAVIRCTSGRKTDSKTISKWARALRYVARSKEPDMRLKRFMKKMGGVNACASLYAKELGRNSRVPAI